MRLPGAYDCKKNIPALCRNIWAWRFVRIQNYTGLQLEFSNYIELHFWKYGRKGKDCILPVSRKRKPGDVPGFKDERQERFRWKIFFLSSTGKAQVCMPDWQCRTPGEIGTSLRTTVPIAHRICGRDRGNDRDLFFQMGGAFDGLHQKMRAVGLFIYTKKSKYSFFP